jgi:protein-S-isoprenylcysteine O-methyltransferase Ste14
MAVTMRRMRLKWVRLIVIPFFFLATPTVELLLVGAALTALGLFIRGWSAGTIHKDEELTTSGPYAFTRNPLYLGSFFIGVGVSVAGGHFVWPLVFLAFYAAVYTRTMAGEASHLTELFPAEYGVYASAVPGFVPRLTPYRPPGDVAAQTAGFGWPQYRRNREWEASLGALAAYAILTARAFLT